MAIFATNSSWISSVIYGYVYNAIKMVSIKSHLQIQIVVVNQIPINICVLICTVKPFGQKLLHSVNTNKNVGTVGTACDNYKLYGTGLSVRR